MEIAQYSLGVDSWTSDEPSVLKFVDGVVDARAGNRRHLADLPCRSRPEAGEGDEGSSGVGTQPERLEVFDRGPMWLVEGIGDHEVLLSGTKLTRDRQ